MWTGYYMDELNDAQMGVLDDVDVLIDGPFVEELKDVSLAWRGSSNQSLYHKIDGNWKKIS